MKRPIYALAASTDPCRHEVCVGHVHPNTIEASRKNRLERIRRVAKPLRPGKAERLLRDDQVGLENAEAVVACRRRIGKQPRDLAVAGAGRDIAMNLRIVIFRRGNV